MAGCNYLWGLGTGSLALLETFTNAWLISHVTRYFVGYLFRLYLDISLMEVRYKSILQLSFMKINGSMKLQIEFSLIFC